MFIANHFLLPFCPVGAILAGSPWRRPSCYQETPPESGDTLVFWVCYKQAAILWHFPEWIPNPFPLILINGRLAIIGIIDFLSISVDFNQRKWVPIGRFRL